MKKNIIKLKKDKRSKIKEGDAVVISKTGKAKKMKTETICLKDINIDSVKKMKLKIFSEKFDHKNIMPEDIINGGIIIKFEVSCGIKFLDDFTNFLNNKIIKK